MGYSSTLHLFSINSININPLRFNKLSNLRLK